ncbi:MAG: amino acid-binding protein [Candidatus Latescibacteria bacterium]|nr:amino acid-binding protein [Candidatus Latescibacterota bacterium]
MNKWSAIVVGMVVALIGPARAADVVIGVPNWPSVNATAHILKVVLEDNLGLEVELQNSTNPIIFEAMDKGSMHMHPEVWLPNQANLHDTYVKKRRTVVMNPNGVKAFQGMCMEKGIAEKYGFKSIADLTDPEKADLLDSDGDGKGEIWIGATGWASTNVEKIRAKSYGYDQTLQLLEMDETLALARLDAAVKQGRPFGFFCYTPHHVWEIYDLHILEEPPFDAAKWHVLQPTDDPDWLAKSSAPVGWDAAYLHIHYARALTTDHPEAASILGKVKFETEQISAMTHALVVEKADPATYARKWVEENATQVEDWLK